MKQDVPCELLTTAPKGSGRDACGPHPPRRHPGCPEDDRREAEGSSPTLELPRAGLMDEVYAWWLSIPKRKGSREGLTGQKL